VNPTGHSRFTSGFHNMIDGIPDVFGQATTGVRCLAERWWNVSGGYILSFNDLSLPNGGLFDSGNGTPENPGGDWHPPHLYHRLGTSVDINNSTVHDQTGDEQHFRTKDKPPVNLPYYYKLKDAAEKCGLYPVDEGPIHFELMQRFR